MQRLSHDLAARANAIHWCTAWVHAFQSLGDAPVRRVLLVLAWHRVPLQEQELGAEEADALGAVLDRGLDVDGRADVCDDRDPAPVVGHRRLGGGGTGASGCLLALGRASLVLGG